MKPNVIIDADGKPRLAHRGCVTYLDGAKIRAARIVQGWSEHTFASALGVSLAVVHRLERGEDQRFLTFALVRDITTLLGSTLDEMLIHDETTPEPDEPDTIGPDDAASVGAVLARFQAPAQIVSLTEALDWTLARTLLALERLEVLVGPTGQRLAWHHDNHVQLVSGDACVVTARLAQLTFATDGPDITETRLLARLAATAGKRPPVGPVRFILGRLVGAGLVDVSALPDEQVAAAGRGADGPRLTPLARYNLVLDD